MAELVTQNGHSVMLPLRRVSIGADAACDIPIAEGFGLAPRHLLLEPWEGGYFLQDAGSGLPTLVNGEPAGWRPLASGDIITAGSLVMMYVAKEQPVSAASASVSLPNSAGSTRAQVPPWEPPLETTEPVLPFPDLSAPVPPVPAGPRDVPVARAYVPPAPPSPVTPSLLSGLPPLFSETAPPERFDECASSARAPEAPPSWLPPEISSLPAVDLTPPPAAASVPVSGRNMRRTSRRRRMAVAGAVFVLAAGAAAAGMWRQRQPTGPPDKGATESLSEKPSVKLPEAEPATPPVSAPATVPHAEKPVGPKIEIRRAL